MNARLQSIIDDARAQWDRDRAAGHEKVLVTIDTSSLAVSADETLAKLTAAVEAKGLSVDVGVTGSWGFNWVEPCVSVRSAAGTRTVLYQQITPDLVDEFVERTLVKGEDWPEQALGVVQGTASEGIPLLADHPFMQGQVRRLMANLGVTDPGEIDHYLAHGGYEGFGNALEKTDEEIVAQMLDSGLGGRGGAGFPAGRKWDFLRTATADPRYLVCNADEGDPGSWVNRILMEGDPHLIVEGMLIASLATHASEGYIYIRYEYPLAIERMQRAVDQAREKGLLGKDILGTGKDFDLVVFKGAGSYVCGEETGLMSSIDRYRGMPRIKPPFPAQAGLWNKPSNVNNVETYANAPMIMRQGAAWWADVSDLKEKGTKMFTISGAVQRTGCIEIPFGPSMKHLLEHYGGGLPEGKKLKGYQPGGPLSGILPASEIDLTLTLDPYRERGMFLGSGGVIFFDESTSIIDLCTYFLQFCEDESCGRCTTCHGGTQRATEILRRMGNGGGRESDLQAFEDLIDTLRWSNCLHGQFSATSIKLALQYFKAEFLTVIRDKRDPTQTLPGLIRYEVTSQTDENLPAAKAICPTSAILESRGQYSIEDELCVRCDACREQAPNAFRVVDRFPVIAASAAAGG